MKVRVALNIAGCEFNVSVEPEGRNQLTEAAQMVDKNINQIKQHGKTIGSDKIAIMAALNIANDLLTITEDKNHLNKNSELTVNEIITNIDLALENC